MDELRVNPGECSPTKMRTLLLTAVVSLVTALVNFVMAVVKCHTPKNGNLLLTKIYGSPQCQI